MTTISVIYPRDAGASFDYRYYEETHLPLVAERWRDAGLTGVQALRGIAGADGGEAPFLALALLHFESRAAFEAALNGPHAGEIMGDIANFTGVRPIVQVNAPIGG